MAGADAERQVADEVLGVLLVGLATRSPLNECSSTPGTLAAPWGRGLTVTTLLGELVPSKFTAITWYIAPFCPGMGESSSMWLPFTSVWLTVSQVFPPS